VTWESAAGSSAADRHIEAHMATQSRRVAEQLVNF